MLLYITALDSSEGVRVFPKIFEDSFHDSSVVDTQQ